MQKNARRQAGTLPLGSLGGIPLRLHLWFFVVGGGLLVLFAPQGLELVSLTLVGALVSLLLHELGHALCARRLGYTVRGVTLHPVQAAVVIEERFRPEHELITSLAGPCVTLTLALLLAGARTLFPMGLVGKWLTYLLGFNALLLGLSLLPTLPQDAGLALRAALTPQLGARRATDAVGKLGFVLGLVFLGLAVLLHTPLLALGALIIWTRTLSALRAELAKLALSTATVEQAMLRQFHSLSPGDRLEQAAAAVVSSGQQVFPVVQGDDVLGVLEGAGLLQSLTRRQKQAYVAAQMRRELDWAEVGEPLADVLSRVRAGARLPILVRQDGRLVGILTEQSFNAFTTLQVNQEP